MIKLIPTKLKKFLMSCFLSAAFLLMTCWMFLGLISPLLLILLLKIYMER